MGQRLAGLRRLSGCGCGLGRKAGDQRREENVIFYFFFFFSNVSNAFSNSF
jgi:hypothetical protein